MKATLLVGLICVALCLGCTSDVATTPAAATDGHDHEHDHAHPQTYADAIQEIKRCRDVVKDAFAAGTPNECDDALHDAVDVLDGLGKLAESAHLNDDDVSAVKKTAKELFGHFAAIHKGFHGGGEGASYEDVSKNIDDAIVELDAKTSAIPHDHAGHDDDADHELADHDEHAGHDDDADHDHADHDDHDHDHDEHASQGS